MRVETRLIVLHIDFQSGTHKCLLEGGSLPSAEVSDRHPLDCCPELLKRYLIIMPDWVSFMLVNVDYEDSLIVYYTCMIPQTIENNKGEWKDIGEINDGTIQRVVFEAGQKALSKF